MIKKKILIFIDWYLPGYKAGGPIQSVANLVTHLKEEFEIAIITRDTDYSDTIPYADVKSNKWLNTAGIRTYYISRDQLNYSTIYKLISEEKFDYAYLNGVYSVYFTLIPLFILRKKHGQHIVIAARGMLSPGSLNVKKAKKNLFLRMVKMARLFSGVTFHATTETENKDIRFVLGDKIKIKTAGNLPQLQQNNVFKKRKKNSGELHLVNIARIAPEKNLLLALEILKDVTSDVTFDFYGPVYDQAYWERCKAALQALPGNIKATYKGSVESGKVLDTLRNAHFLFMPTTGENFGHIILQALSTGSPVIISDKTPWQQLESKQCGWDIALDQPEIFIKIIDKANRMTQTEYDQLSEASYAYAMRHIDNPQTITDNKELFGA